ncbi:hypothetical protein PVK06_008510 [Gossypium arboreum]|uniref:Reverse transcriptase domain-containing protein n=1 Tax=Gossypium arboreum TaxID=29729 RepID=A0ABR0QKB7_GOSAR|nr:hypothetical protein PVK06_008510 [Gossypium arboreum]
MDEFRDVMEELSFVDIKTEKGWFTWVNTREGNAMVKERLDRLLISANDVDNFPFIETRVARQSKSDHDAIILDTIGHKLRDSFRDPRLSVKYDVDQGITDKEILEAFNQMNPRKMPEIDGLSGCFFKENWEVMGADVIKLCHDVLNGNRDVASLNDTMIILISKTKDPKDMSNFRPISLCRVLYKIISKVLANGLKTTLPMCIIHNQNAFVLGVIAS